MSGEQQAEGVQPKSSRASTEVRALALAAPEARDEVVTGLRARITVGALEPVAAEIARALLAHGVIDEAWPEGLGVS